jgi:hypothetical protein
MRLGHLIKIDIFRRRNFDGARGNAQHLTNTNFDRLLWVFVKPEPRTSFENNQFAVAQARRFENDGCAGDTHGHGACFEFRAPGILWHAQKNCAAFKLSAASGFVESENRICAQPCDRQIIESKFGARFIPGAHGCVLLHFVVLHCCPWFLACREQIDLFYDLRNTRFLFLRRFGWKRSPEDERNCRRDAAKQNLGTQIHCVNEFSSGNIL